jgi:hypothetical protein
MNQEPMQITEESAWQLPVFGRLTGEPEGSESVGGVAVCRMTVAGEANGPASSPPIADLYLTGPEATRCVRGLHEGDLIATAGTVRLLRGSGGRVYPKVVVPGVIGSVRRRGLGEVSMERAAAKKVEETR